jgi:hypothetical protein
VAVVNTPLPLMQGLLCTCGWTEVGYTRMKLLVSLVSVPSDHDSLRLVNNYCSYNVSKETL